MGPWNWGKPSLVPEGPLHWHRLVTFTPSTQCHSCAWVHSWIGMTGGVAGSTPQMTEYNPTSNSDEEASLR